MGTFELSQAPVVFAFVGSFSIWHWLIVLVVVLLLFGGKGKIPNLMKDVGSGINAFKKGMKEDKDKDAATDEAKAIRGRRQQRRNFQDESRSEESELIRFLAGAGRRNAASMPFDKVSECSISAGPNSR